MDAGHYIISIKEKLEKQVNEYIQQVVNDTYEAVIAYSPSPEKGSPFSKGSFVQSHRIGIDKAVITNTNLKGMGGKDYRSEEKARAELGIVPKIKHGDIITISNTIPWAEKVEYKGWKKAKPYYTYKQAEAKVKTKHRL